ncbi:ABC transporter permease [Paraburkholderia lycopersici]|uniref:Sulfonate transport system permease protein n=1 Tax=Paraburkholderia lycopersici TaxID=416944 RepID=A0A1G6HA88_9BURK|nr:ABC transporter permease [Paraburkholderia lycopersici]SDB91209.1 sulfonate transport system permease protein [Paraburkholderia lycopersici]
MSSIHSLNHVVVKRDAAIHRARVIWRRLSAHATYAISPMLLLSLWAWVAQSGLFPPQILSSPLDVWRDFLMLLESGELQDNLGISMVRLLAGFVVGALPGIAFGIALALSRSVEAYCGWTFATLRQMPTLVMIPMFVLVFGVGETLKIVIVAKATFFPVALATCEAVRALPRAQLEVAQLLKLRGWVLYRRVVLPAVAPGIVTGIRIALSRSWLVLISAELLAADSGVGEMMQLARQSLQTDTVMVCIFIAGAVGFLFDRILRGIERSVLRWQRA